MADTIPSTLRGIAWSAAFAGIGGFTGMVVEQVCQKALRNQEPRVRAPLQFIAGIATLGPILQFLMPYDVQPPIGDGILMQFFFTFQPRLMADIWVLMSPLLRYFESPRQAAAEQDHTQSPSPGDKLPDTPNAARMAELDARAANSLKQPANVTQQLSKRNLGGVTGLLM